MTLRGLLAWTRRGLLWSLGLVALLLALVLVFLHTSAGRSALLSAALRAVERSTGLVARAEGIEVSVPSREVRLRSLSLGLAGSEPLLRAAEVRLTWSLLPVGRGLVPETVDVRGLRIDLARSADGHWNLPVGGGASAPSKAEPILPLRTSFQDVAVTMSDAARGLEVRMGGISLDTAGSRVETAGTLAVAEPLRWRVGNETGEIAFTPAAFRLGRGFSLTEWTARSSEATVRLKGTWSDVFANGRLDLAFDADLDLGRLAARAKASLPAKGSVHLAGQFSTPSDGPRVDATWAADEAWVAGRRVGLAGHAILTEKGLDIGAATVKVAGGSVEGAGRVGLGEAEASRFEARWTGLDLASLLGGDLPRPPRLQGLLAGHANASWPGLAWRQARAQVVVEAGPGGKEGLPVEGDVRFDLRGGRWTVETDVHSRDDAQLTGQLGGDLGKGALGDTPVAGSLDLAVHDLAPITTALGGVRVAGQSRGRLVVSGTLGSPRASIDLLGAGVRVGQDPPVALDAQGTIDGAGLTVDGLDVHSGSAHLEAAGRFVFANRGLEGHYELDLPDLAALGPALPPGMDPGGSLHGTGSFGGTWSEPKATLSAQGGDLRVAGQTFSSARFELSLEGPSVRAETVELVQSKGKLTATGAYDRRERRFSLGVQGRSFEIAALPPGLLGPEGLPLAGSVDVDFEGGGTMAAPEGRGRVILAGGSWEGRSLGPIAADLGLTKEGLRAEVTADDFAAHAQVTLGLAAPHAFSAAAQLEDTDLAKAAKLLGQDDSLASGTVTLAATATGSANDVRGATVELTLGKLSGILRGQPVRLGTEARLETSPGQLRVTTLDVSVGEGRLVLDGALDARGEGTLKGKLQGRLGDLARIVAPMADAMEARFDGNALVSFAVSGALDRPRVFAEGSLDEGIFRFDKPPFGKPERPPLEHLNAKGSLDEGTLRLDHLEAAFAGASLTATGEVTLSLLEAWLPPRLLAANSGKAPRASLNARVEGDAGLVLAPFLNDTVRGSGSGKAAVLTAVLEADEARPEAVHGEIRLEGADLQTSDMAIRQQGAATLRVQEGRLILEGATWSGPSTELRLSANAKLGPKGEPLGGAELDAELAGDADLHLLQAFARGIESGGTATFRIKVAGKPAALRADGEIHLRAGTLRHRPTRVALDGLTGTVRWGTAGFEMEGLQGSLNGGPFEASGVLRRREAGTGYEGAIHLQARNAFLEWPPGLRAGLRANLVLEPAEDGLQLAGSLRIRDGSYRTREYFSLQVLDLVNRFSSGTSPSRFDALRLDLSLKSNEDVQLDAVDGKMAVGIDLHLGGTVGLPVVGGRLTAAAGGQVFMSGRTYDVDSAYLDFTRGAGFEPYVQARATTRVSDYTVVADVAGPATRAQTRFASTPPLGEQDIVALLTSGRTMATGGTGSQSDAISMASGGMLGKTGQRLGLDSLKIEGAPDSQSLDFDPTAVNSEANPASRLTFSKRLASNLSATFSRSLTKAGNYTWFVAWKPKPSLELRVVQRDDQSGALEFRHDITLGGGKAATPPPRRRRRQRRSGETVSAISITGDPVSTRVSDLKMQVGQPFDYERWLDDRDRLEGQLAREGHREGRVLASRETPAAPEAAPAKRLVALVYDVRRGPTTTLIIQGVPAPDALRERIERAWQMGDFESTIEEEALALTRAYLYEKGFLRAQATARVVASPEGDVKTLTVRAEPGAPVLSRRILFEGCSEVSCARLDALVKDKARAETAWLVPESLRQAVLAVYESDGFLAASVEIPKLTFAGDLALLTVKIDEGPVVPIREVSVTGAERLGADAVRAAAGLREGQPFKPAEIQGAKARVEAAYRRLGYNEATVRSEGALDAATGAMKVSLEVKEGRREVLAEVTMEGGSPKQQARAKRRLRLEPGAPVVLDQWAEARRRVYETGLFRSVDLEPTPSASPASGEGDQAIDATVRLEEWPALRLRYGLQMVTGGSLASEEGRKDLQAGAVTEVSRQTIFGRAASVGVSLQLRKDEQEARGYLSLPRTLGTPIRSSLFLTVAPEHNNDEEVLGGQVDIRKTELTWEERIRARRRLDFAGAYKLQWSRLEFAEPVPDLGESGRLDITLARLVGTVLFDARNDLIDTTRGAFSSASVEWGGSAIGSDYPLTRTLFQQFAYLPTPGRMVLGAAARVERASGQGSAFLDTDRLQAGGANTVRGYSEDALTSRSIINLLGGSTILLVLNGELRFPIHGPVRGVVFGDGAVSKAKFSEESSHESIWSTGLGLRYVTPVGILRLDYGIPLDEGFKPKRGRVYFSLGQVF